MMSCLCCILVIIQPCDKVCMLLIQLLPCMGNILQGTSTWFQNMNIQMCHKTKWSSVQENKC